jgi:acetyl-CoA C-acetyltransferase
VERGFFDDLVILVGDLKRNTIPRKDTSLEKLAQLSLTFDRTNGGRERSPLATRRR